MPNCTTSSFSYHYFACPNCDFDTGHKSITKTQMAKRLHYKVCKKAGRTKPKMTREELDHQTYVGFNKKSKTEKEDEYGAIALEHIIKTMTEKLHADKLM